MRHIIDTHDGAIVFNRLAENCNDPLDFMFELESIPSTIEERLRSGIKAAKEERFNEIVKEFPDHLKKVGYENVDQIPEYVVFTELNLKFSNKGNGLEHSEIRRYIVDVLDGDDCNFETDTSIPIDLSDQIEDLKQLALTYLEKIMFQKREVKNYIM